MNYDLLPARDGLDLLNQYTRMQYSERKVLHYDSCLLECDHYFRFDATAGEIDQLIQEQGLEKLPYSKEYYASLLRFQPGEKTRFYRQGNLLLYYDEQKQRAYVALIDR